MAANMTLTVPQDAYGNDEALQELDLADVLSRFAKRAKLADYYSTFHRGEQSTDFISSWLRTLRFHNKQARDQLNFLHVAVAEITSRVRVETFGDTEWIDELDARVNLKRLSRTAVKDVEVKGASYGFVWPRAGTFDVLVLDPSEMICGYGTSSQWPEWAVRRAQVKTGDQVVKHLWLMSAQGWSHIRSQDGDLWKTVTPWTMWPMEFVALGSPPVVEFGDYPGELISGIAPAIGQQKRLDRLMDTDAPQIEFASTAPTYVLSEGDEPGIEDDDDICSDQHEDGPLLGTIRKLRGGPGVLQQLRAKSVVQLAAANPDVITNRVDQTLRSACTVSRLPLSIIAGAGGAVSGEAITRESAALIQKCNDRIATMTSAWARLLVYAGSAAGVTNPISDVNITWADPSMTSEAQRIELALKKQQAGVSRRRALLDAGIDEADIESTEPTPTEESTDE